MKLWLKVGLGIAGLGYFLESIAHPSVMYYYERKRSS